MYHKIRKGTGQSHLENTAAIINAHKKRLETREDKRLRKKLVEESLIDDVSTVVR